MANLCIVAIPASDDDIWEESSEKVPHMTFLFLGDADTNPNFEEICEQVGKYCSRMEPFSIRVDHRGVLGPDKADVLFFSDDIPYPVLDFNSMLRGDVNIRSAYNSIQQYPEWNPHLTLGYPETPAKGWDGDEGEIDYITFDKIAVWNGDYSGQTFQLVEGADDKPYPTDLAVPEAAWSAKLSDVLEHHGTKGMKWGVKGAITARSDKKFEKKASSINTHIAVHNRAADLMEKHGDLEKLNNKPEYNKAAEAGHLLNDSHPTTQKYLKEYMSTYTKRANEAAGEMTNKSGTKKYTAKPADGFFGFSVSTTDVKHADSAVLHVKVNRNKKGKIIGHELQNDTMKQGEMLVGEILSHHGVKGMRWGVRNGKGTPTSTGDRVRVGLSGALAPKIAPKSFNREVQRRTEKNANKNSPKVTVTQKGKKKLKATGGVGKPAHKDAVVAKSLGQQAKKSGHQSLSNEELQRYATRLNLEQNVKRLEQQNKSGARRFISGHLKGQGNQAANKATSSAISKAGKAAVTAAMAA